MWIKACRLLPTVICWCCTLLWVHVLFAIQSKHLIIRLGVRPVCLFSGLTHLWLGECQAQASGIRISSMLSSLACSAAWGSRWNCRRISQAVCDLTSLAKVTMALIGKYDVFVEEMWCSALALYLRLLPVCFQGGKTPLYLATKNGNVGVVEILLEHKASLDNTSDFIVSSNKADTIPEGAQTQGLTSAPFFSTLCSFCSLFVVLSVCCALFLL